MGLHSCFFLKEGYVQHITTATFLELGVKSGLLEKSAIDAYWLEVKKTGAPIL